MTQIWKFALAPDDKQTIAMPIGATLLSVHMQDGRPCIWAEVNPTEKSYPRMIEMFGTGQPIDGAARKFLGTILLAEGQFVFHVFERLLA